MNERNRDSARRLAELLKERRQRVVFAESCTAGLVAATLGSVPGVSASLCGSMVTYRERTKVDWLSVDSGVIEGSTAVSPQVAEAMASGVLRKTEEADYAASITGHLGPDAPASQDGLVYIGLVSRQLHEALRPARVVEHRLRNRARDARRREAVELVFDELTRFMIANGPGLSE